MDINLMVLNVGNTRLAVGVFVKGSLEYVKRLSHEQRADWEGVIRDAWDRIKDGEQPSVAGASVNPPLIEPLEHVVKQVTGETIEWVGREIDISKRIKTDVPAETGVDRVLGVMAAYEQMGKACVVVDAGTAITVNCCDDKGNFIGGAIAPGVAMQLDALHDRTAKLPRVNFAAPAEVFGKSTEQAILNGVYHGARGMVKELLENYATELGNWPEMIATGGDAEKLFEGWELVHAISPDLTLYGIALAYAEHYSK
jgi:type III pantothenate kinase